MDNPEIIIKAKEVEDFIAALSEEGPSGKEEGANPERTIIVSRSITAQAPSLRAELHKNYTDIFLIKEGEEELFIGGEITDQKETEPGEWRGQNLEGARSYQVKAGDIVIIPKGVAHRHGVGVIKMVIVKIGG